MDFVSVGTMNSEEPTSAQDLESLGYVLLYTLNGGWLTWTSTNPDPFVNHMENIAKKTDIDWDVSYFDQLKFLHIFFRRFFASLFSFSFRWFFRPIWCGWKLAKMHRLQSATSRSTSNWFVSTLKLSQRSVWTTKLWRLASMWVNYKFIAIKWKLLSFSESIEFTQFCQIQINFFVFVE